MKLFKMIVVLLTLTTINVFSQEKKLLLRYDEISKSELDVENMRYNEKGKIKTLGTILVYSKKVLIYDEEKMTYETYDINEVKEDEEREFYISKSEKQVNIFALTKDKRYFTQIGKKERSIYRIIDHKFAEE